MFKSNRVKLCVEFKSSGSFHCIWLFSFYDFMDHIANLVCLVNISRPLGIVPFGHVACISETFKSNLPQQFGSCLCQQQKHLLFSAADGKEHISAFGNPVLKALIESE